MSHEDNLVYLFTHFAKHYRETGVGIRQALDLYVYQQKHPDIDKKKVLTELKRLQLERFYANMQQVLKVWFHGEEHTEASRIISDRLFASGVFGNETNRLYFTSVKLVNIHRTIGRAKLAWWTKKVFPPYSDVRDHYPVLVRFPMLLPLAWIRRWIDVLLNRRNRIRGCIEENGLLTDENEIAYREMLHKSGLDFNFK